MESKEVEKKINGFIELAKQIPYLKPDGKPKPEWKVFYGKTWQEAKKAASAGAWDATGEESRMLKRCSVDYWEDDRIQESYKTREKYTRLTPLKREEMAMEFNDMDSNSHPNYFYLECEQDVMCLLKYMDNAQWSSYLDRVDKVVCDARGPNEGLSPWRVRADVQAMAVALFFDNLASSSFKKQINQVKSCFEVWQKGYALLLSMDGVLYVYAKQ